ncbi:hypothetical protein [Lentzea sp. NEAU-D7]|uniref:hypothetical protein n=1 Tax=Lentzea sp. NEAU-D7 TaxID=2994667 RepID=UPI00224B47E6|nr:hypothetical protein [Lentzea sp. NEAU-D7]MCX2949265.1 hypothetical protein [Lentzea sp. NEAU-D7]
MRNHPATARRSAVVVALMLLAVFVLHPACPPEPSHHAAFTPGVSGEICHHGETHHASPAAPAQAAVQVSALSFPTPDADGTPVARPARTAEPSARGERVTTGRTLLLDLGISRT